MNIWLVEIWRAWRSALRRPAFLLLATGVLALGVGASVGVFTLIDNVLLQPLPYPRPSELVSLGRHDDGRQISPKQYQHMQSLPGVSSLGLVMAATTPVNVTDSGKPEQVTGLHADHGLLPTLEVHMYLGRNFSMDEDQPYGPKAVILSFGFWQRRYGSDPNVIARIIQLEGVPYTIVGVLPAGFDLLGGCDVMLPTALPTSSSDSGTNYLALARMVRGVDVGELSAQLNTRLHAVDASIDSGKGQLGQQVRFDAVDLRSALHAQSREVLMMFLVSALFVLLVVLVNLATLMVLRALARSHDIAVRAALGAPPARLACPALAEGLLVGAAGALAGLGLAAAGLSVLHSFVPPDWLAGRALRFGPLAWGLALVIGLSSALLSAALGLWRGRAVTTIDELREGGRSGMNRRSGLLGRILVVAQVSLATTLLCGAGIFLHVLYDGARTPLGFSAKGVLTFELAPVKATYPNVDSMQALSERVLERLTAQPGIEYAAAATNLPIGGPLNMPIRIPGGEATSVEFRGVSPGYFPTFAMPLGAGRIFSQTDGRGAEAVAVVNQEFAREYFGGHALGKTLQLAVDDAPSPSIRIVGVVSDTRQFGPLQPAPPILYVPLAQVPDAVMVMIRDFIPLRFAIRVKGASGGYRESVQTVVKEVAPQQPIANIQTLASVARGMTDPMRLNLLLVGLFALLSLLLASAGMYAVMAVAVAAREREFGVRLALGATPARLMRLVVRGGLAQIAIGLVLGVGIAWILSRVLRAMLEEVGRSAFDPVVIASVCVVLAAAGSLACLPSAVRAGRVPPLNALTGQ